MLGKEASKRTWRRGERNTSTVLSSWILWTFTLSPSMFKTYCGFIDLGAFGPVLFIKVMALLRQQMVRPTQVQYIKLNTADQEADEKAMARGTGWLANDGVIMNIEAYFERIGYKNSRNKLDLETLTDILQHQIQTIPFENLNIHCGETMELGLKATFEQVVSRNRGGWCLQVNHLLCWALTTIGFETTMLGGYVYSTPANKYSNAMIHLLLKVTIDSKNYIVDAGFGRSYQMWQPLELISGKDQLQVPCIFRLTEERGIWYLDQIRREQYIANEEFLNSDLLEKGKYRKIYSFTLEPRTIEDFESVNTYLQISPTSVFTSKSFCSLQTSEGVHCLVGCTLTYRKFNYKDNMDLVEFKILNKEEIEQKLKNVFNISLERKFVPKHGDQFFTI